MPEARGEGAASLESLCTAFGIAPAYDDIWGKRITVPKESLVALLAELGVDAGTPERIAETAASAQAAAERAGLPPVAAIGAGVERWALPLRWPTSAAKLHWTLTEEGGTRHEGDCDASASLEIGLALPAGYHRLTIEGLPGETLVIAAPARCYRPAALAEGGRIWGPAVQLYALRSERNWGVGDFGDLAKIGRAHV